MGATELCDGIVTVLAKDPFIQAFGTLEPHLILRCLAGHGVSELIKKELTNRLGGPGVASKQCALHHLGQVSEYEHVAVDVAEVRFEEPTLGRREGFRDGSRIGHTV